MIKSRQQNSKDNKTHNNGGSIWSCKNLTILNILILLGTILVFILSSNWTGRPSSLGSGGGAAGGFNSIRNIIEEGNKDDVLQLEDILSLPTPESERKEEKEKEEEEDVNEKGVSGTGHGTGKATSESSSSSFSSTKKRHNLMEDIEELKDLAVCTDFNWCSIPMPKTSFYKFKPPQDMDKWKAAQILAASGAQVLLKRIVKVFPNPFDFLDGDRSFRRIHRTIDIFVDEKNGLGVLKASSKQSLTLNDKDMGTEKEERRRGRKLSIVSTTATSSSDMSKDRLGSFQRSSFDSQTVEDGGGVGGKKGPIMFPWELEGRKVVPEAYNFRAAARAPIVQMGYTAFTKDLNSYFSGNFIGGAFINRNDFFKQWKDIKNEIDVPFITVCSLNENWGVFSTMFPNRTAAWGSCCSKKSDDNLHEFLNHPKTLMMVINQHSNLSHPKILTLPRGVPLTWEHTERLVWDSMRHTLQNVKKDKLLHAAVSKWGKRS